MGVRTHQGERIREQSLDCHGEGRGGDPVGMSGAYSNVCNVEEIMDVSAPQVLEGAIDVEKFISRREENKT